MFLFEQKQKKYEKKLGLKKVKDTYENVDDYIATFEPLLFEEVKAQIAQSKEADDKVKPKVVLGIEEVKVEDEEKGKFVICFDLIVVLCMHT